MQREEFGGKYSPVKLHQNLCNKHTHHLQSFFPILFGEDSTSSVISVQVRLEVYVIQPMGNCCSVSQAVSAKLVGFV